MVSVSNGLLSIPFPMAIPWKFDANLLNFYSPKVQRNTNNDLQIDGKLGLSVQNLADQSWHINARIWFAGDEHRVAPEQREPSEELFDGLVVVESCLKECFFLANWMIQKGYFHVLEDLLKNNRIKNSYLIGQNSKKFGPNQGGWFCE